MSVLKTFFSGALTGFESYPILPIAGGKMVCCRQSRGDGTGSELWVTDGTSAGTKVTKDLNSGRGNSSPSSLAVLDGKVYFAAQAGNRSAYDGNNIRSLWRSDGTSAGTVQVQRGNESKR